MIPPAFIAHRLPGRIRLRIPSRKGDSRYFLDLERGLRSCPGVKAVSVNPVTASVLVSHAETANADGIARCAKQADLFALAGDERRTLPLIRRAEDVLRQADERLIGLSRGASDLRSTLLLLLLGAGLVQLVRGEVLGSASTLLWYAFELTGGVARVSRRVDEQGDRPSRA
jgi:hypothetical protein